jgi:hypothetical protein
VYSSVEHIPRGGGPRAGGGGRAAGAAVVRRQRTPPTRRAVGPRRAPCARRQEVRGCLWDEVSDDSETLRAKTWNKEVRGCLSSLFQVVRLLFNVVQSARYAVRNCQISLIDFQPN